MSFDIKNVNGFGDGSLGDVTISNAATQLNSYANVTAMSADGKTLTIGGPSVGAYGGFAAGQEIMFHVTGCLTSATADLGKYGFAKILSVGTGQIVLDTAVPIINLSNYICQVVTVPNVNNLTVSCALSALAYSTTGKYGGIIIAKAKGAIDLTNGSLLAEGKGLPNGSSLRPAGITVSNSDVINKLIMSQGNGIVIPIASNLALSDNSRLGASWSGALGAGAAGVATTYDSSNGGAANGSTGGIGQGAGGAASVTGGSAGYSGNQGEYADGTASVGGYAGATVLIIAPTISGFSLACFSTGGQGGHQKYDAADDGGSGGAGYGGGGAASYFNGATTGYVSGSSGGGAGFGYIATTTALTTNTIAYALDTGLIYNTRGLIINQKSLDCRSFTSVDGFTFAGTQPSGTDRRIIFSLGATKVAGSRTFPITTNAVAADTVTIGGVTLTATASTTNNTQFTVGASVGATAVNIAAALNANGTFTAIYTATADSTNGIVTVTENSSHVGYGNTPAAATKTGTIGFGSGTTVTSVPTWFKLTVASGVATMTAVATQTPMLDSVLSEGNAITDLTSITSIPAFVGQRVNIAAALMAPYDATVMPTLSVTLKGHNNQDQYSKDDYSAEYTLASSDVSIVGVTADTTTTGNGTAAVLVSLKQSGTWSGWMTPISAKGQKASAIKFKSTYTVTTLDGTDTAKINRISCIYCNSNSYVSGNTAEILTITADYEKSLSYVRGHVVHKKLMDAEIKAYVSFREKPKVREMLNIGTGTAERQLIQLTDTGINHNTLQVFFDGKPTYNFDYNTELSQVLVTAAENVNISASYQCGWEKEEWLEMQNTGIQPKRDGNNYMTSFAYELPSDKDNKSISVVKVELYRPSGTVTNETIGTGTGKRQLFVLPHFAKKETLKCSGSFSYDDNSRILTVVATKDADIKVTYDWIAETHELSGLVSAWNE